MSKTKVKARRHDKTIKEMTEEHKSSAHRIDKKQVSMKAAEGSGEIGGSFVPSDQQLEKINQFTRVEATKDNVVAFSALACNDLYDRDDERFTKDTIKAFSALPQPYSPIGKSYMADHEYKMENVRGRIFDATTKKIDGVNFLVTDQYIPKTDQHKDFIENIDFGLNWAVSVGVVIDAANCSICKEPVYNSRWFGSWCANGHEKGYFYVPGSEEDDGWGFFIPVDPSTKGAVKAQVDLSDPVDFYELSQVFLGAQYYAELAKKPGFKGMMKAASAKGVPIIGLSSKEAESIPMPHRPKEVDEAQAQYTTTTEEDGSIKWTDSAGLQWKYDSESGEVLCLGKSEESEDEEETSEEDNSTDDESTTDDTDEEESDDEADETEEDDENAEAGKAVSAASIKLSLAQTRLRVAEAVAKASETEPDDEDEDPVDLAQAVDAVLDEVDDALDSGDVVQAQDLLTAAETTVDELIELLGGTDADDVDSTDSTVAADAGDPTNRKEGDMDRKAVLQAAKKAKLPMSIIESIGDDGDGLESVFSATAKLIADQEGTIKTLEPRAKLGEQFIEKTKADALHWYTVAHKDPKDPQKGVNVDRAKRLIEAAGDDPALINDMAEEWKETAQKLFPPSVRRSTAPVDPNEVAPPGTDPFAEKVIHEDDKTTKTARRIHSR